MPERMCQELQPIGTLEIDREICSWKSPQRSGQTPIRCISGCRGQKQSPQACFSKVQPPFVLPISDNLSIMEPWLFSLSEVISFTSISPKIGWSMAKYELDVSQEKRDAIQFHHFFQLRYSLQLLTKTTWEKSNLSKIHKQRLNKGERHLFKASLLTPPP